MWVPNLTQFCSAPTPSTARARSRPSSQQRFRPRGIPDPVVCRRERDSCSPKSPLHRSAKSILVPADIHTAAPEPVDEVLRLRPPIEVRYEECTSVRLPHIPSLDPQGVAPSTEVCTRSPNLRTSLAKGSCMSPGQLRSGPRRRRAGQLLAPAPSLLPP